MSSLTERNTRAERVRERIAVLRRDAVQADNDLTAELRIVVPRVAAEGVDRLMQAKLDALRELLLGEIFASMLEDPKSTLAWLEERFSPEGEG